MTREDAKAAVSAEGWLAARPPRFREQLLGLCQLAKFRKGQTIYSAGDPPGGVYGLIEGSLRIELVVEGIGAQVAFVGRPGFWIGVASAIRREKRVLTLSAASPSQMFYLPIAGFEALAGDSENMRHFAILNAENADLILSGARDLMNPDITARVASRLLAIFGRGGDSGDDPPAGQVAITQADLAMVCNVSRKTINQELASLAQAGLIRLGYGTLALTDVVALRRVARGAGR